MKMDPKQVHMAPFGIIFIQDGSHKLWEASGMPPELQNPPENPKIHVFRVFPYFQVFSYHPSTATCLPRPGLTRTGRARPPGLGLPGHIGNFHHSCAAIAGIFLTPVQACCCTGMIGKYKKILENTENPDFWISRGGFEAREASQRLPRACGIHLV